VAACPTCGGDGLCKTCQGKGFIYSKGEQVYCSPTCGKCGGGGVDPDALSPDSPTTR
jgi:hypothetical protein